MVPAAAAPAGAPGAATLRIVTYNIHGGVGNDGCYDLERIAATLRRSRCDIACLQEVEVNANRRKPRKWSHVHADNQAELLAAATGLLHFSFAAPLCAYCPDPGNVGRTAVPASVSRDPYEEVLVRDPQRKTGHGNAILTRLPILGYRVLVYSQDAAPLSEEYIFMDREPQPRGARAVLVDAAGASEEEEASDPEADDGEVEERAPAWAPRYRSKWSAASLLGTMGCLAPKLEPKAVKRPKVCMPLWVVNTHLSHRACSSEQRSQAKQLMGWIDELVRQHEGPVKPGVVLCGDLNSAPLLPQSSYSQIAADGRWRDAWSEGGATFFSQATFPSSCCPPLCGLRLDHVFLLEQDGAPRLRCRSVSVLGGAEDAEGSDHCPVQADLVVLGPGGGAEGRGAPP